MWVRARNSSPSALKMARKRRFVVCWARCPEAQPGPAAAHRHRGLALWSVQCPTDQQQWGFCSIRGCLSACRRRVGSLMTPFPPFGGGEVAVRGGVVPKVQTTSAKNAENRVLWAGWTAFWAQWCQSWWPCCQLGPPTGTLNLSSPGFCAGLFRPLPFVLLCVGFLLVAV